jgi:hypothetical protein
MTFAKSRVVLAGAVLLTTLASTNAWAHWCDDLWSSAYDIVVRPDSDTSPKELYVENRWGYQLVNFKLTATSSSGGSITLTAPTTLKVANTLLPGEKGTWKITSGTPAKIEDLTFHVTFGNTSGSLNKQYACYPVQGASPVMVVKKDGSLFPNAIAGIPTSATELPKANTANGCTYGDISLGRSLQEQTIADWDDVNIGLDNLMTLYCAGRASWGNNDRTVKPNSYCKDASSTSCPTVKPAVETGSRSDYMRLWGAGALAIRKASLGTRLPVLRERLKCGANDADPGIAGYTLFALGYLGDDSGAKSFLQTQASASGDIGTIAKAALYLMGDTSQKSAVQAGVQSSSLWIKVACAGALGIVDKDDASVNSAIIPEVKWVEPDNMGGDTDNGKGMYAAHILEIVAIDRRGWIHRGDGDGAITFYGEDPKPCSTCGGTGGSGGGGSSGAGGASGSSGTPGSGGSNQGGNSGIPSGSGGAIGHSGGASSASGGTSSAPSGTGGATGNGSGGAQPQGSGGSAGSANNGGASGSGGGTGGKTTAVEQGNDCKCNVGGQSEVPALLFPALTGLAFLLMRRRRQ